MPFTRSNFLDKVLGRIGRLDAQGLQTVVQRLGRERTFLETLLNTIEDGVLVTDEQGRILYLNNAVTDLLGLPQQDAEGQPLSRYLPQLDWRQLARMDKTGGGAMARHEMEVSYPRPRFLSLYVAPLDGEAAGSSGLALIVHDATEARQKTFEAIESERVQALTLLAASVAHEIGNPLNALHIHLQLMERELIKLKASGVTHPSVRPGRKSSRVSPEPSSAGDITERMDRYLAVAKGEIVRLDYIVTQFLQAIRPVAPRFSMVSLNDVVHETVELLRPEMENRGLRLRLQLAERLPAAPLDPAQIKQALVNLVKNAIQAMTKDGVLALETYEGESGVWVAVTDTGRGIAQEQINRIFQPFYTTKKKGSGLGLMIVQRITRDHGGRITVQSQVGQGTTFRIWLPRGEAGPRLLPAGGAEGESQ